MWFAIVLLAVALVLSGSLVIWPERAWRRAAARQRWLYADADADRLRPGPEALGRIRITGILAMIFCAGLIVTFSLLIAGGNHVEMGPGSAGRNAVRLDGQLRSLASRRHVGPRDPNVLRDAITAVHCPSGPCLGLDAAEFRRDFQPAADYSRSGLITVEPTDVQQATQIVCLHVPSGLAGERHITAGRCR